MEIFSNKTFAIMLISLSLLLSCSNDDSNDSSSGSDDYVTAKIDGASWESSTDYDTTGAQKSGTVLVVQGSDNDGNAINFSIANYNGTGTYKTGDNLTNGNQLMYVKINPAASWSSNLATAALGTLAPGTINVTADDGTLVEGTFSFEGYNANTKTSKNITEGKFKASLD